MPHQRGTVSEADIEKARRLAEKIRAARSIGLSTGAIGSALRLKVEAVEKVLSESPPEQPAPAAAPPESPPHSTVPPAPFENFPDTGPATDQPEGERREPPFEPATPMTAQVAPTPEKSPIDGAWSTPGSIYEVLFSILRESGIPELRARGVVRVFRHQNPSDFGSLDRLLRGTGITSADRERAIEAWRLEMSTPGEGDRAEDDPLVVLRKERDRHQADDLRDLAYRAERARYERELAPPAGQHGQDPRLDTVIRERDEYRHRLEQRDFEDRLRRDADDREARIRREYDAKLAAYASRSPSADEIEARSKSELASALTAKVKATGSLQSLAHSILEDPLVKDLAIRKLKEAAIDADPEHVGVESREPSDDELRAQVEAMDGAGPARTGTAPRPGRGAGDVPGAEAQLPFVEVPEPIVTTTGPKGRVVPEVEDAETVSKRRRKSGRQG